MSAKKTAESYWGRLSRDSWNRYTLTKEGAILLFMALLKRGAADERELIIEWMRGYSSLSPYWLKAIEKIRNGEHREKSEPTQEANNDTGMQQT